MGKRALMFIPNTPALVAWGQKPTTCDLSNLINGRTEGNILNSKALLSAYEQVFSVQRRHEYIHVVSALYGKTKLLCNIMFVFFKKILPSVRPFIKFERWRVVDFCPHATSAGVFGINMSALFPFLGPSREALNTTNKAIRL